MRPSRRTALAAAALALAVAAPVAVARPAAAPAIDGSTTVSYVVPTRDAAIYLEVVHPTSRGKIVPAPAILTLSPYSALGRNGDADHWVPQGYARMYADVVGTGNSGGCYDYGGLREQRTGHDVVEWVARQKWTTGKVGMLGGSYDGTTQLATAITKPKGLETIVPEAAISQWYGYAYSGGIRYTLTNEELGHQGPTAVADEGFDTPLGFDFGFAMPPPLDPENPQWAERVGSTIAPCDEIKHTEHGYDLTPDYDAFWDERDYRPELRDVTIPVLVAGNWGDWNVKQEESWFAYHSLVRSKQRVLYMGTRWEGHGTPSEERYQKTLDAWFGRYLQGRRTGVEKLPSILSQTSDSAAALSYTPVRENDITEVTLNLAHHPVVDANQLDPAQPGGGMHATHPGPLSWLVTGTSTESRVGLDLENGLYPWGGPKGPPPHMALTPSARPAAYQVFQGPVVARDLRIVGSPTLRLWSTTDRRWVTVTPSLFDIAPGEQPGDPGNAVAITRGWLDSRYRETLRSQSEVEPGTPFQSDVVLKPTDYTLRKGHRLALVVTSENAEWSVVKDAGGSVQMLLGGEKFSTLTVPLLGVPNDPAVLYGRPKLEH